MDRGHLESIVNAFQSILLREFPPPPAGRVLEVRSSASISEACSLLTKHNILALPVVNMDYNEEQVEIASLSEKYLGMIDTIDILRFAMDKLEEEFEDLDDQRAPSGLDIEAVMSQTRQDMAEFTVKDLIEKTGGSGFNAISSHLPLSSAVLALGEWKTRRIVVVDPVTVDLINIITQSSIIEVLLNKHILKNNKGEILDIHKAAEPLLKKTIAELGFRNSKEKVLVVDSKATARAAFSKLYEMNVSALAVVDEKGTLIGNISATDIRNVAISPNDEAFYSLLDSLEIFLEKASKIRTENFKEVLKKAEVAAVGPSGWQNDPSSSEKLVSKPIVCKLSSVFGDVLRTIHDHKIHRIYVVDDDGKPQGVISLGDIINLFVPPPDPMISS